MLPTLRHPASCLYPWKAPFPHSGHIGKIRGGRGVWEGNLECVKGQDTATLLDTVRYGKSKPEDGVAWERGVKKKPYIDSLNLFQDKSSPGAGHGPNPHCKNPNSWVPKLTRSLNHLYKPIYISPNSSFGQWLIFPPGKWVPQRPCCPFLHSLFLHETLFLNKRLRWSLKFASGLVFLC